MNCDLSYKENEDDSMKTQKIDQYLINNVDGDYEEDLFDDNDQSLICSESISKQCIELMENGESPFEVLKSQYDENTPIFNAIFIKAFLNYFDSTNKDLELTYFIVNGPIENSTRLIMNDFFNILYTDLPDNLKIIHHLLSKASSKGKIKFVETGGIYILCYFISNPDNALIISQIFLLISDQEVDFFDEVLPPNAISEIKCNFDTTLIYKFKDFIKYLLESEDLEILENLIQSLKNMFCNSDDAIQKLGNLVFQELFIKRQFLFDENQKFIPELIEMFNILSDQFDFEIFKIDLIQIFYTLLETSEYKIKVSLMPPFLSLIDSILIDKLPEILKANTLHIFEDMAYIENNISFLPNIIETVSDIASQIVMLKNKSKYEEYLSECRGILDFLSEHEDSDISQLAQSATLAIGDIVSNLDLEDQE